MIGDTLHKALNELTPCSRCGNMPVMGEVGCSIVCNTCKIEIATGSFFNSIDDWNKINGTKLMKERLYVAVKYR